MRLWDYAVAIYALDGVKERLLTLQDRYHFDVNAVIWCVWCSRIGIAVGADEVRVILQASQDMTEHTVRRLRGVRRFLSAPRPGYDDEAVAALRRDVLALEVRGEELVLQRLEQATLARCAVGSVPAVWQETAVELFTLARKHVDMPTMIADEGAPESPIGLFRSLLALAKDYGP